MEQLQAIIATLKQSGRLKKRDLNHLPDYARLSRTDVAMLLGVHVTTLDRQVKAGKIPPPEIIAGKPRWRVDTIKSLGA
jgi:hypothetical protein